jgi:two-component system OmpR family sensor kinase
MSSLRARLIAVLLVAAAVGLLALAVITYAEQRSFLLERVDGQVRSAQRVVDPALEGRGLDPDDIRRADGARGPSPGEGPPPGTFVQRRPPAGPWIGRFVGYETGGSAPDLPADLPLDRIVTVDAGGAGYRVLAQRDPHGDVNVVAVPLRATDQTLDRLLLVEALVIGGVLLVLGVVAALLVRLGLRPLDRIGTTAGQIAAGDLSHRVSPATPRTEVGRLGLALNAMLDRLEEAFAKRQESEDRLRRFLSDASHELRTPLASIRGYAEVFRMGAASDRGELERAMRRIEDEAARMGVLVEDLLMLARLDELRDPVRQAVDLAAVARDAVDDARATAPDRSFALDAAAGASVLADPHQIRQVLANLLRNAIVHTPAGTPVEVGVAVEGSEVTVSVRDHGPGLPVDDAGALFDRFWRAEPGRERGKAGAGLGLAIVAAIVEAHRGRVHAANAPDGGACFMVLLPAAARAPAHAPVSA